MPSPARLQLMAHLVAGDPDLESSRSLILELDRCGVEWIEIQIPFSDPLADGPTILSANHRALAAGTRPGDCLDLIAGLRGSVQARLVLMTYANIAWSMGLARFAAAAAAAGAAALIVPDLPVDEEGGRFSGLCRERGLALVPVLSAGMRRERLRRVLRPAGLFAYLTLRVGVTGARRGLDGRSLAFIDSVKSETALPLAAGFGISTPGHLERLRGRVQIAVVGSRLIDLRQSGGLPAVVRFIRRCRRSARG